MCIQTWILFCQDRENAALLSRGSVGVFHPKRRWSFAFHLSTLHRTVKPPSFLPSARWQTALLLLRFGSYCPRLSRSTLCYLKKNARKPYVYRAVSSVLIYLKGGAAAQWIMLWVSPCPEVRVYCVGSWLVETLYSPQARVIQTLYSAVYRINSYPPFEPRELQWLCLTPARYIWGTSQNHAMNWQPAQEGFNGVNR